MEEAAFLRMIAAAPDDDAPRLIFADWLDERGDPRGNFVRVQCALARMPADDPARSDLEAVERDLLAAHGRRWAKAVIGRVVDYRFRRGLIDDLTLTPEQFLEHGAVLARLGRIGTVRLPEVGDRWETLVRDGRWRTVRGLDLCGNQLGDAGVAALANSPLPGQLESLDLSFNAVSAAGLATLLGRRWPKLRTLDLRGNDGIAARGAAFLAHATTLPALTTLDLSDAAVSTQALAALCRSQLRHRLRDLRVAGNPVSDRGVEHFANSGLLARHIDATGTLDLSRTDLSSSGLTILLADPCLRGLRHFNLANNLIDDRGALALSYADLPELRELNLSSNLITDDGAYGLATSPIMKRLGRLDMDGNMLSPDGMRALVFSEFRNWRTILEFTDNRPPAPEPEPARDFDAPIPLVGGDDD